MGRRLADNSKISRKKQVISLWQYYLFFCFKKDGTTNYCIGLSKINQYYVPSSCLLEDIRNVVEPWNRVIAVFSKSAKSKEECYSLVNYIAKDYSFNKTDLPKKISELLQCFTDVKEIFK